MFIYFQFCVCWQLPLVCCFTYYEDKLSQFVISSILHLYHLWIIICVSVLFLYWALYCLPFFDLRCLIIPLIVHIVFIYFVVVVALFVIVLCAQCCQCLWVVHFLLFPSWLSLDMFRCISKTL